MMAVFDASVVANWFLATTHHEPAVAVARSYQTRLAPDLLLAEVANAFWLNVRGNRISIDHAQRSLKQATSVMTRLEPSASLGERAISLACKLNHPAYDCFYLALAEYEGIPLVTVDKRLASVAERLPNIQIQLISR